MKKIYLLVLVTLAVAGCQKDSAISCDKLYLSVEGMRGEEKLAVEGAVSYWASGDRVRINEEVLTVSIDESAGTAVATSSGTGFSSPYRGVYPSSIYSGNSSNTSYTLNLPANYTYATTTHYGRTLQNLQAPMVAYTDEGTNLKFKHVTGAVAVQVVNYYGFTIEVDNIVVTSTVSEGNAYNLCGMTAVTLSNGAPVVAANRVGVDSTKSVTMNFDGTDHLQIFAGDSAVVQIPVLPVGDGNRFKVQVTVHKVDQLAVNKTFENTQNTGGAMPRAKMGYARFTTGGLFTVNASGKKVIISQGNLQYQASTGKWKFAENQYGFIGATAGNSTTGDARSSQTAWIDIFSWATSGYDNTNNDEYAIRFQPWMPTNNEVVNAANNRYGYGPSGKNNLTGVYAEYDWGVHNSIENGGKIKGRWRSLSGGNGSGEWFYMLGFSSTPANRRNVSNSLSDQARYTLAKIGSLYCGMIIFPDVYVHPEGTDFTAGAYNTNTDFTATVSMEGWYKMEAAGAVFLPAAGYRTYNATITSYGMQGRYWTTSCYSVDDDGVSRAYYWYFSKNGVAQYGMNRSYGASVRLVRDVN